MYVKKLLEVAHNLGSLSAVAQGGYS